MAVNNTLSVKEYALGTTATSFPITFEYTTDDSGNAENIHCQRAMKNDEGQYIESEELAEGLAGDFTISGGNVNYIDDVTQAGKYLIIYRSTPVNQLTDFIDNGNYSLEDIERALDKLTFILQERTGTPVGTYINVGVSLFFASILQLTNKKDFLNALFASWNDIADADKPIVAGNIRGKIDAVSNAGNETISGHKTFTYSPDLSNDPVDGNKATRKSYVDNQIAAAKGYTDGKFPIGTSQISDGVVTQSKIPDGSLPVWKMRWSGAVDLGLLSYDIPVGNSHTFSYNLRNWNSGNPVIIKGYTITRQNSESSDCSFSGFWADPIGDTIGITATNNNVSHARWAYFRVTAYYYY